MAITWGAASGYMRVGVDLSYSGSPASGAVTVTAKLIIQSVQYGHDWTYPIYWSGSGGSGSQQVTFYSPWNTTTTKTVKTWTFSAATQYGKTTTVTVSSSLGPIWNKGNPSVTARLSVPARPYAAPAAPTNVNVKRTSATQAVLSWSIASTTSAPVLAQGIERWDAQSKTWNRVSTVGGSIRSWTDVSLTANNAYTYRVWGDSGNAAGAKTQAAQYVTSTIAAPTSVNAVKQSNGNISVSWATAYPGGGTYDVYDNGTRVATATSATTFTHVSPSAIVTHSYTVTQSDNGVTSPQSASSNTVQLLAAPAAPTFKSGSGSYSVGNITLSWVHNPVDGSAQTAANVRYRAVGASSWTTATTTTAQSYTASFTAGSYEWQVQTKGLHADYSPWSEVWSFGVGSVPTVAITSPTAGGVVPTSRVTVTWTYTQTENSALKSSQIQLISGTDVIEDVTVVGNVLTKKLGTRLNNGGSYQVKVRSLAANGLWSAWVTQSFTVAFPAPPTPQVTVTFDYETLQAKVSVVNPAPLDPATNVRRNLAKYPGCTDSRSVYGWAGAAPASTEMSIETVDWTVSGKAVQTVWVTGGSGECGPRIDSTGTDGLTEGSTYTVEYDVVINRDVTLNPQSVGGLSWPTFTMVANSGTVDVSAGVVVHRWATFVCGSGTDARISNQIKDSAWLDGDSIQVGNILIYPGAYQNIGYFDGDMGPNVTIGGQSYAVEWDGTPGASTSTATPNSTNAVRNTVQRSVDGGVAWSTLADTRLNLITYDDKALTHGDTLYRVYATSNDNVDSTQVIVKMNVPLDSAHLHTPETVRGCATREVFFAVGDHSSWFPSPAVGMTANNTSWGAVTQLTNGFNTVVGSVYASRTYELSWTHLTRAQAETFRHLFLTAGNKPVFFLDPFASDNVLSQIGGLPVLHIDTMSPIAWSSIGDLRAERTGESSVIFSDITEGSVKYTERVVIPKGKYAVLYVAGDGSVFSGFEVDDLRIPTNVVEPFDGPRTLDIVFNPVIGTRVDYAVVKILPLYEQIPNSVDFSYPSGGGNMRVVPGSAILTPVNNALGIYSASLSLTEVWPW